MTTEPTKEKSLLSPWAHPKAQAWFSELLDRSAMMNTLEDEIRLPYDDVELGRCRMLLTLLTLMGRPGIWPKKRKKLLQTAALKIARKAKEVPAADLTQPLTLNEHRKKTQLVDTIQQEVETLRRFAGVSNRKNEIGVPKSWGNFWG